MTRFEANPATGTAMTQERTPKVLLLDDEKFLLDLYKIKFEKNGYETATYTTPGEALAALRAGYEPDVILFDIMMPDNTSGYEFLEIVKRDRLASHSVKIALTNEGHEAARERMAELGADAYFFKADYTPQELVEEVTNMLKAKRRH